MIITPFKQFFEKEFAKKQVAFKNNPSLLVEWVKKNIRINSDKKALQIAQLLSVYIVLALPMLVLARYSLWMLPEAWVSRLRWMR